MLGKIFHKASAVLGVLCIALAVLLAGRALVNRIEGRSDGGFMYGQPWSITSQSVVEPQSTNAELLKGQTHSLGWIVGRDCQAGMQAYRQSAAVASDVALVGTGWVDPTTGQLINGDSNSCMPGSLSMDNVVQLVHSKGGMAYLTITMQTDGAPGSWTPQQAAAYVDRATTNPALYAPIIHEVTRAHYDGVIMDLEGIDLNYPAIQQIFATYNQHLWAMLRPLHKWYGIALIHKISDRDAYYGLNGFENWRLLGHSADFMVVMAVDQSYFTPGPSVSIPWLRQLLDYTLQTMPQMLPHIIWELPLYGNSWHWHTDHWVFEGIITFQQAQDMVAQASSSQIDTAASDLHDPYAPHLVYMDSAGMKHSVWYLSARGLYATIAGFKQALQTGAQYKDSNPGFAFWWRTTQEPPDFWSMLATSH
ncbi:MAG: hypothetical protein ABI456_07760 [Ktedonobacteraceae bacterium]|nr:hypothetical protein [Chloroflexota bacterium]